MNELIHGADTLVTFISILSNLLLLRVCELVLDNLAARFRGMLMISPCDRVVKLLKFSFVTNHF